MQGLFRHTDNYAICIQLLCRTTLVLSRGLGHVVDDDAGDWRLFRHQAKAELALDGGEDVVRLIQWRAANWRDCRESR